MRYRKFLQYSLTVFLILGMSGCWILSFSPLYHQKDIIFDINLLGYWDNQNEEDDMERWTFLRGEGQSYRLIVTDEKGVEGEFQTHMLRLGNIVYLDCLPAAPEQGSDFQMSHLVPCHSFLRIKLEEDKLFLRAMDYDWLDDRLKDGRITLRHARREDGFLLTASTQDLQEFIKKYSDEVFSPEAGVLIRALAVSYTHLTLPTN